MEIQTEYVTLKVSDGSSMRAYIARPQTPRNNAGLIVCQEAFGVNAHIKDVTERFAKEGYIAIAPEFFHRTAPGFAIGYDALPQGMEQVGLVKDKEIEADLRAAYDWLCQYAQNPQLPTAAVGFCMGGRVAFLASMVLPLKGAVSFYGGGIAPSQNTPGLLERVLEVQAPLVLFWGGQDQHLGYNAIAMSADALRRANKEYVNIEFSYADHGFFCDARANYHPHAATEAWDLTLRFLKNHLA